MFQFFMCFLKKVAEISLYGLFVVINNYFFCVLVNCLANVSAQSFWLLQTTIAQYFYMFYNLTI